MVQFCLCISVAKTSNLLAWEGVSVRLPGHASSGGEQDAARGVASVGCARRTRIAVRPIMETLHARGFRLSTELIKAMLIEAGED